MSSIEARAFKWVTGRDTGMSSKAILAVMTGNAADVERYAYPSDGGDLGRCLRLLEIIPEWRARLHEMRPLSPQWAALVDHWDELAAMHANDDKRLYDRMKELLRPIEKKDPSMVVLGDGMSIHFPSRTGRR